MFGMATGAAISWTLDSLRFVDVLELIVLRAVIDKTSYEDLTINLKVWVPELFSNEKGLDHLRQ
jgi:hypothetical protein